MKLFISNFPCLYGIYFYYFYQFCKIFVKINDPNGGKMPYLAMLILQNKLLDADPDADNFHNLICVSSSTDTSVVKFL